MTRSPDTTPDSEARVIDALRAMRPTERLAIAVRMSAEVMALTEAGVRSRQPDLTPEEARAELARIVLGRMPDDRGPT